MTGAANDLVISRREILRIGGMIIPVGVFVPAWLTANAQSTPAFDFYISPTGSDTNSGTSVSSPWAITSLVNTSANFSKTSGKRIGFLPGTYKISSLMAGVPNNTTGAIQIDGGTASNPTVYASCDANGIYNGGNNLSGGVTSAVISVKTSGGAYGGGVTYPNNGPILGHIRPTHLGNITVDGLTFTGGSYKCIRVGGSSSADGPAGITGVTIQNCVFTDNSAAGQSSDNVAGVWVDGVIGAVVQNNYFHDNFGPLGSNSMDHLTAIFVFGPNSGSTYTQGTVIRNNTVTNAGGLAWGKIGNQERATVQFNYCDASMYTSISFMSAIFDFSGIIEPNIVPSPLLVGTTVISNNILLTNSIVGIGRMGSSDSTGYVTPFQIYNNTLVMGPTSVYPAFWVAGLSQASGGLSLYNNIYTGHADTSGYKSLVTNPGFPAVIDYNMYIPSGMTWALRQNSALGTVLGTYTTASAFGAAIAANGGISGAESHSILANPTFANTGTLASLYKLAPGSAGMGAGRVGGVSTGAACDMGAWGGANPPTRIGCNLSTSVSSPPAAVPMSPVLTVS